MWGCILLMNVQKQFDQALNDTVEEWKKREQVEGVYVFGSYAAGIATIYSDLDICIVWKGSEAPVRLLAEHKGVRIDMIFLSTRQIEGVISGQIQDPFRIAEVIGILDDADVVYDSDGSLREWQEVAADYRWSESIIEKTKREAIQSLEHAEIYVDKDDTESAVNELRNGLFDLGRVIVMKNNEFGIIRPSEVLAEVRMLDPIAYPLFLRTFKLKGMEEEDVLAILDDLEDWLTRAAERVDEEDVRNESILFLSQAQREFYGAHNLAIAGDLELAVLELRLTIRKLGFALLATEGLLLDDRGELVDVLREREPDFFERIFVEYGAFDFQPRGVKRSISEAKFIANRV
ncbi:nucleotidyltransferase domain-containing protein [Candidatus Thorarchaeota archaeon]|nr:MAG: nucleotidyltransferase domain-containing protein [Candidatus Thorarchaeota archaeon]